MEEYSEYGNILNSLENKTFKNTPTSKDFQNSRKIFHHIDRVLDLWKKGDTNPVHLTLGLTNYCQHKCPWCYINYAQAGANFKQSGINAAGPRAINADDRIINAVLDAKKMGLKAVTIIGDGEPTLHKKFAEYSTKLKEADLDLGLFSNFSFKKEEVLEAMIKNFFFIRGSIDSAKKEYHDKSHGANDFDLIVSNITKIVESKKKSKSLFPIIGIQYVTNRENYKDLPYAAEFYKNLGADYLTIKPMYKNELNIIHKENDLTFEEVSPYMKKAEAFSDKNYNVYAKYTQFIETLGRKTNNGLYYKKCNATPVSPYLDEDGNLEMCGNLKGRGFTMGNVHKNSFKEIWNSKQRKSCLDRIDLSKCPAGCKLDPLNKVLWDTFNTGTSKAPEGQLSTQEAIDKVAKEWESPEIKRIHPNFT